MDKNPLFILSGYSSFVLASLSRQCLNKKLTKHQQLQLCKQELQVSQQREQAKDLLIASLQLQISGRDDHIETILKLAEELKIQLAQEKQHNAELERANALLKQANQSMSEKISQQQQLIDALKKADQEHRKIIAKHEKELQKLENVRHGKKLYAKQLFGRRSEKIHEPVSRHGFFAAEDLSPEEQAEAKALFVKGQFADIGKQPNPSIFEQGLEVVTTVLEIPDLDKTRCRVVAKKTTHQVVHVPARNYIHKIVRLIYMEKVNEELGEFKRHAAPFPEGHIPRSIMDVTLMKQLMADKYLYHMPINRERKKLMSSGLTMPYNTLNDGSNRGCKMLYPLWELQLREVVRSKYIHCDETTIRVIDKSKPIGKKSHNGQMMAMANPIQKIVCFKYIRGRGHIHMEETLRGFTGYLHTDGYGGYKKYGKQQGVIHAMCLVHARRNFVDCQDSDFKLARYALRHFFGPIYAIEQRCRDEGMDWEQITGFRQKYAIPILEAFHKWLLEQKAKVKPHKPIAKAINYILNIWDGIMVYTTDGMLMADNNYVENQIRPLAQGKHSWLFVGSHDAAPNAATMFTLLGTCKLQGINPEIWLSDVLSCIQAYPKHKLADLLPQNWKNLRGAALCGLRHHS